MNCRLAARVPISLKNDTSTRGVSRLHQSPWTLSFTREFYMLGFASIGELTFGGLGHAGAVIILTGNQVTVSQGSPTINGEGTVTLTGNAVTVSQNANGITFIIDANIYPTGSELTLSTGAEDVNVITWNPIDPNTSKTWTNIDPL